MKREEIIGKIEQLRREKDVIILAHYYTNPEVQDLADYIGDSLGLSQMAAKTDASIILFCGVKFMAETASIIAPGKKVLIPDITAGCSLADSIIQENIIEWREKNPNGVVVSYVNTTAEVKALTDICCTSANAVKVIESIPQGTKILFGPDKNLAQYIQAITGRDFDIWNGDCCVHEDFTLESVKKLIEMYPDAELLIHPESSCSHAPEILDNENAFILSTSGMVKRAGDSKADSFIVVTEPGVLHQMKLMHPNKHYIPVDASNKCYQMRKVTLEKMLWSLENEEFEVAISESLRAKAYPSIERMLYINTL